MKHDHHDNLRVSETVPPRVGPVIDGATIEAAFNMLNEEGRSLIDVVDRALNMYARQYLAAKARREAAPRAKDLRAEMQPFSNALEALLLTADDLSPEVQRALGASGGPEAETQLWEEAGEVKLSDVLCDLIVFSERFGTWFNMPRDPKGPQACPELAEFVTSLIGLYTKYIEAQPTHSASKDSVNPGDKLDSGIGQAV